MTSNDIFINWLKSVLEVVNINEVLEVVNINEGGNIEILRIKDGFNNNEVLSVIKEWLNEL